MPPNDVTDAVNDIIEDIITGGGTTEDVVNAVVDAVEAAIPGANITLEQIEQIVSGVTGLGDLTNLDDPLGSVVDIVGQVTGTGGTLVRSLAGYLDQNVPFSYAFLSPRRMVPWVILPKL